MSKVLVVDDSMQICQLAQEILDSLSIPSSSCSNGFEALQHLENQAPPQLIILDIDMPIMNGHAFLEVKSRTPAFAHIPVIVCSSGLTDFQNLPPGVTAAFEKDDLELALELAATLLRGSESQDTRRAPQT
jgi:CheY-like chemotaxis protein